MQSCKLGYQAWGIAIYMAANSIKGISSMKLHRELVITMKASWHRLQRIREVFSDGQAMLPGSI